MRLGTTPNSLPDEIKKMVSFDSETTYGQLRFDESKELPLLMIKLSYIPSVLLGQYFLTLSFNQKKFDLRVTQAQEAYYKELAETMFPDVAQKHLNMTLEEIERDRKKALKNNPDMNFFVQFYKYETKEYTHKSDEYWMTFEVSTKTAMMIIEKKSTFEDYIASFECPDKTTQKETQVTLSIIDGLGLTQQETQEILEHESLRKKAIVESEKLLNHLSGL